MQRRIVSLTLLLVLIGVLAACQGVPVAPAAEAPAAAESEAPATMEPSVTVADQPVVDGMVTVAKAVSAGPGWIVIHAQADGKPGPVIGHAALMDGVNENVAVEIDESAATDVLYAMLHTDAGEMGTYEFPGPDGPVKDADGNVITPAFNVTMGEAMGEEAMAPMVMVADQPVVDGMVTVAKAVSAGPGWMVIHAQADGKPGPVIGHAALMDGVNENVTVEIDESAATDVLYAMLHTDAGDMGTYEFPGPDGPVKDAEGNVITPPFNVTMGEAMGEGSMATIVTNGARLRVRAEPSLGAEIIGHVNNGESYEVMGVSDDGAWVNIAGVAGSPEGGWVSAQFVKMRE